MNLQQELSSLLDDFERTYSPSLLKNREVYGDWLAQTYFYVVHSTPLLGYALPHLKNAELRRHFEKHLGEESKHDLLALKDIERLDYDLDRFSESASTQAFYQAQYYRIAFEGGTSLLGYILYLEAMAVRWGKAAYEEIKDVHRHSTLFLKVHAEEDPHHVENAIKAILKLSAEEQEIIRRNMNYSHQIYSQMLQSMTKKKALKMAA